MANWTQNYDDQNRPVWSTPDGQYSYDQPADWTPPKQASIVDNLKGTPAGDYLAQAVQAAGIDPNDPRLAQAYKAGNDARGGYQTGMNPWGVVNDILTRSGVPALQSAAVPESDPRFQAGAAEGVQRDAGLHAMDSKMGMTKDFLTAAAIFGGGVGLSGLAGLGAGGAGGLTEGLDSGLGGIQSALDGGYGTSLDGALAGGFNAGATAGNSGGLAQLASNSGTLDAGAEGLTTNAAGGGSLLTPSTTGFQTAGGLGLGAPSEGFALTPGAASGAGFGSLTPEAASGISTGASAGAGLGGGSFLGGTAPGALGAGLAGLGTASGLSGAGSLAGATTAASGTSGAASTALQRVLGGNGTAADFAQLGLQAAPGLLGAVGANQQSNALSSLAGQYMGFGAPSRARYEASMSPGFDPMSIPGYSGAVDSASKGLLSHLSATGGNPYGNPGGMIEANKAIISGTELPAIQNYQSQNAAAGGLSQLAGAAPGVAQQAIGSSGGVFSALGSAANSVVNPQQSSMQTVAQLLKSLGITSSGVSSLSGSGYSGSLP